MKTSLKPVSTPCCNREKLHTIRFTRHVPSRWNGPHGAWRSLVIAPLVVALTSGITISAFAIDTIPVGDLKIGMKGYGLSVFEGTEPSRFDVKILGVFKNQLPKHDFILVVCTDPYLKKKGVSSGMSGSPVYFQDKLAGALSRTFAFAKEPYALITPIKNMLAEAQRPQEHTHTHPRKTWRQPINPPTTTPDQWALAGYPPIVPISTPLYTSGASPRALAYLRSVLQPFGFLVLDVGAGGGAADPQDAVNRPDGPPFRPGDAISVYLIKGDWVSAGTGTVTAVLGDTILAFGHSMFGGGEVALPIGRAQVFDVLPNQNISFKLSAPLEEVGMLTQDRMSAIVGTTARRATMLPLRVNIRNPNTKVSQTFSLELARHEFLTPRLMVYAMLNLMDVVENVGQTDSVVKYTIGLTIKGHAPVIIQDTFTNEPMPPTNTARPAIPEQAQMILHLFSILNNPFEKLELETVAMEFEVSHTKRKAPISMVWMDAPEIAAGSTATIHVNLKPYHHDPIHEQISMIIPASLPPGEYQIQVSGGHEAMVGRPAPESLEDLIARYDHRYTNQMLVAKLTLPFVRLTQQGVTMRSIPGSYVGTIVGNGTTNIGIERDTLEISKSTTWTVIGKKQLRLTITPKKQGGKSP